VWSDFKYVTNEQREAFGEIYLQYVNRSKDKEQQAALAEAEAQVDETNSSIDTQVTEGEYVNDQGEIVI
jgi:hypothetical protein